MNNITRRHFDSTNLHNYFDSPIKLFLDLYIQLNFQQNRSFTQ